MSHTIRKANLGNTCIAEITILDYVSGGEAFTLAELGLTGSVVFVSTFTLTSLTGSSQSFGLSLVGATLKLMTPGTCYVSEIPTTPGLNYSFVALIHGA